MAPKEKKIWDKKKFSAERRALVEDVYAKFKGGNPGRPIPGGGNQAEAGDVQGKVKLGDPSDYYDKAPYVNPPGAGLFHQPIDVPIVHFKQTPSEEVIQNGGSYIVLGRDRPGSNRDGYGAKGALNASSIDMVVGRMASARAGDGVKDGTYVDPSFSADAARIHISQMTDLDKNFGIATEEIKPPPPHSGIAIKADAVRIIGREGVKIVTGKCSGCKGFGPKGETNSVGGKLLPAPRIELIAGNNVESRMVFGGLFNTPELYNNLQGVARGENVVEAFRDLAEIMDEVLSIILNFTLLQGAFNAAAGVDPIRPWVPTAAGTYTALSLGWVQDCIVQTRTNKTLWEVNHLYPIGYRFIPSRNVYST